MLLLGGEILAAGLSWRLNASVAWAIAHFLCSWPYVCWCVVARTEELVAILRRLLG
jgi:hypothetical protein